jgi:hypothetical protein
MGFEITGMSWTADEFNDYIQLVPIGQWAKSVTVHHTYSPDLEDRPEGWKPTHLENLRHYYGNILGWSAGPHLFVDEHKVWGLSSMYKQGIHAKSFNKNSIGIEALGNYDVENPKAGRGYNVWLLTAITVAIILKRLHLIPSKETVLFHREDPKTNKTCPGSKVKKEWFLSLVNDAYNSNKNLTIEERVKRIEDYLNL